MNVTVRVMSISMITNIFLALFKIIVGFISRSSALVADGLHSFSDLITDVFAIIGVFLSKKPADQKHPYGHGRLEYLTSIVISLVIMTLGFMIIYNSTNREIVIPSLLAIFVSIITITLKLLLSTYVIKMGKKHKNNILISSGYESSTDVISSIIVLISTILMQLSKYVEVLKYSDIIATIIVGVIIIKIGFDILKDNVSIMLGEQETDEVYIASIKDVILKNSDIKNIDSLVILKFGPYYKLIGEVSMNANHTLKEVHDTLDLIEEQIKVTDSKIKYITIHVNPYENIDN